jgi:hypothetical protein
VHTYRNVTFHMETYTHAHTYRIVTFHMETYTHAHTYRNSQASTISGSDQGSNVLSVQTEAKSAPKCRFPYWASAQTQVMYTCIIITPTRFSYRVSAQTQVIVRVRTCTCILCMHLCMNVYTMHVLPHEHIFWTKQNKATSTTDTQVP